MDKLDVISVDPNTEFVGPVITHVGLRTQGSLHEDHVALAEIIGAVLRAMAPCGDIDEVGDPVVFRATVVGDTEVRDFISALGRNELRLTCQVAGKNTLVELHAVLLSENGFCFEVDHRNPESWKSKCPISVQNEDWKSTNV